MKVRPILNLLGIGLVYFSFFQLLPIAISLLYEENNFTDYSGAFFITLITGIAFWVATYKEKQDTIRIKEGFILTVAFWVLFTVFASLPFLLSSTHDFSIVDAYFETTSALTTTGSTVLVGLEAYSKSLLFYRALLQWLGGMGIIVLAVAIFPLLGVGGMQLYKNEGSGVMGDNKLRPKIAETAKSLWFIYLILTLSCCFCYFFSGMSLFDAVTHSFTTVAIGGFSNYDESFAYFDSNAIYLVCITFMFLSGANFSLHFLAYTKLNPMFYFKDSEFKFYGTIIISAFIVITAAMVYYGFTNDFDLIVTTAFQTVSFATTTGYVNSDYFLWPSFIPFLLLMLGVIGACAGSTGGGIKMIRVLVLYKQGGRELKKLTHPQSVVPVKIGGKILQPEIAESVWGFFSVYILAYVFLTTLMLLYGSDFITAFSAVGASINNLGPGLGDVSQNYNSLNDISKITLSFAMILGRLEIYTLLVLMTPFFWKS